MKYNATRIIQNLLLFTIACAPVFALREFLKFSSIASPPHYFVFFNLVKDFLLAFVFSWCLFRPFTYKNYPLPVRPVFFFSFAFTALVAFLSISDILMVIAGLRWSLPMLIIFLLYHYIDRPFLNRLANVSIFLLIVTTIIQIYQVANRQFRWGPSTYSDLFGRVSGFYELPSTTGFITCLFFFIIRYYYNGPPLFRKAMLVLAIISNFLLSISTTGFILMLIMLIFPVLYRPGKFRPVYIVTAFALAVVTYFFLDKLNGRYPGDSSFSWNVRIGLMEEQLQHAQLISSRFGNSTNAMIVLKQALGKPFASDITTGGGESFYPPLLGNYGSIFFILFGGLLIYLFVQVIKYRTEAKSLFFFITVLGAFTVRITEIFPLGIIIAILAAYYIGNRQKSQQESKVVT